MMVVSRSSRAPTHRAPTRAQALTEFALVLPIFLLLLCTLIDGGRWVYTQNALNQATREAARGVTVLSRPPDCGPTEARATCAQKVVRNRVFAVGGVANVTTTCWRTDGLGLAEIPVADCLAGDYVRVSAVVDPWQVVTPLLGQFLTLRIDAQAQMLVQS